MYTQYEHEPTRNIALFRTDVCVRASASAASISQLNVVVFFYLNPYERTSTPQTLAHTQFHISKQNIQHIAHAILFPIRKECPYCKRILYLFSGLIEYYTIFSFSSCLQQPIHRWMMIWRCYFHSSNGIRTMHACIGNGCMFECNPLCVFSLFKLYLHKKSFKTKHDQQQQQKKITTYSKPNIKSEQHEKSGFFSLLYMYCCSHTHTERDTYKCTSRHSSSCLPYVRTAHTHFVSLIRFDCTPWINVCAME